MNYYIYHIPNFIHKDGSIGKIGCTTEPQRRVNQQGYENYEIIEQHIDIMVASNRELELQKQYGYKVDSTPYYQSFDMSKKGRNAHTKESYEKWSAGAKIWREENKELHRTFAIAGGKKTGAIQGKRNVESGLISSLGKKMSQINNRLQTCPHCGITAKGFGFHRWHGDRCKNK